MLRDKLSPGTKPGFLKSEKMLGFKLLYIHKSVSENVYVNNVIIYGWCYSIILTHNVFGWCYCQLGEIIPNHHFCFYRLMVLPFNFFFQSYFSFESIQILNNITNVWSPWSGAKSQPFWEHTCLWFGQCITGQINNTINIMYIIEFIEYN